MNTNKIFKAGQFCVHPKKGLCYIIESGSRIVAGKSVEIFILKTVPEQQSLLILKSQIEQIGLRPLVTPEQAEKTLQFIRGFENNHYELPWSKRYRDYIEKLNSGSLVQAAFVYKSLKLFEKKSGKKLSFGETKLLEQAQTRLVYEFCFVLGKTEIEIEAHLKEISK